MASKIELTRFPEIVCVADLANAITVTRPTDTPNTAWNNQNLDSSTMAGDVELSFEVAAESGNTPQMIGLNSDINTNASWNTIDYAYYLYKNGATILLRIYENGAYRFNLNNGWLVGDVLTIRKTGTLVEYLRNGAVLYTSTVPSTADVGVDSSFYYANGTWGSGSVSLSNISLCSI